MKGSHSGFFCTSITAPKMGVVIDTGSHLLNQIIDSFLVFAIVAAVRVLALELCHGVNKGSFSKGKLQDLSMKMCKEGAYWGIIVALYVGLVYAMQMTHILGGWINAMLAGALTGALVSSACNSGKDKIVKDTITGGFIATAIQLFQYFT
ncbi:hypothetical protein AQUCO_00300041v1 [Aquilegia coerulea]|uniref:Uncharacterized protein n=1 Tax=Aquilegia coerulea TaxID=218851 RepID=A0A2G5EWV7_AQUCA|nr:hypothetical protein AQUCO_00300041v1 [Aquilegia coerulea]